MTATRMPVLEPAEPAPVAGAASRSDVPEHHLPWIVAAFVVFPFLGWWSYGLFDPDEGFYGAIVGEMLRRHEWVTPFYNGAPWYEKPVLIYWAAKPFVALFGREVGPRLPSVLATLATIGLVAWFARRRLAAGTRYVAPLVLASSLLVVGLGRMLLTDPLLVLCLSATLLWFWESLVGDARWRMAAGAALGAAVLAKGPLSIALFVAIAGFTWWREPALRPRFRGWWGAGTLLCAGVVALWYLPIYLARGDEFVQGFIVEQNINRFLGGDTAHTVPGIANLVAYVPVVLLGMIPWSFFLWRAWPTCGDGAEASAAARRYLATWGTTVFVFFTLAGSKLPHYMLPAIIPFGVLVADDCARRWAPVTARRLVRPLAWTVAVAIIAQLAFTAYYYGLTARGHVLVPGFQSEVHRMTAYVRARAQAGDVVVEYRTHMLPGTRSPYRINETTHPSLRFYLDRVVPVVDDFAAVLAESHSIWLITRRNRIGAGELGAALRAGRPLEPVTTPFPQDYYALYRLSRPGARRVRARAEVRAAAVAAGMTCRSGPGPTAAAQREGAIGGALCVSLARPVRSLQVGRTPRLPRHSANTASSDRRTRKLSSGTRSSRSARRLRASLGRILANRLPEIERMLGDRTPQARQMLRALLADKIEMEPVVEDGRRGYRCRGVLRINPLLADAGTSSLTVVAPTGFEPVFTVRHALSQLGQRLREC